LLVILSPIIRRIGTEGWHEIFSGTRVITDGRPATGQLLIPDPKPECDSESTFLLGPYRVGQILHRNAEATVYLGEDTQLNRNVWVHLCESEDCGPSEQRIVLARTARQRWLNGGVADGKRWDAYEAIEGLPLQTVVASRYRVGWPEYRKLMQDVAEELQVALKDGTMPETLSLPQVWLDRSGNAKIIDRSLVDVVEAPKSDVDPRAQTTFDFVVHDISISSSERSAAMLIKTVGKAISKSQTLPLSAQSFMNELRTQPESESIISWTIDQIKALHGKLDRIDWETRVGVLGITIGIEYMLYSIFSAFMYLLAFYVIPAPNSSRIFIGLAMSLMAPMALGIISHGGIIFHLMGISVTNKKGKQVGRLKLIARSFLSWLPACTMTGVWMITVLVGNSQMTKVEPEAGSIAADLAANPIIVLIAIGIGLLCLMANAAGILTSLVSPTRGLQDYLIGTRLTPK